MTILRAMLLVLGLFALLPTQVEDAKPVGGSVLRECQGPCGVKARSARSDQQRAVAVLQAQSQNAPDDGFVPIPVVVPPLVLSHRANPLPAMPRITPSFAPARLERPPKTV